MSERPALQSFPAEEHAKEDRQISETTSVTESTNGLSDSNLHGDEDDEDEDSEDDDDAPVIPKDQTGNRASTKIADVSDYESTIRYPNSDSDSLKFPSALEPVPTSYASSRVLRFSAPSVTERTKPHIGQAVVDSTNAHGIYPTADNSLTPKGLNSSRPSHSKNDNESIYSELASSFSNNFLFSFARRENPLKSGGLGKEFWLEDASASKCFLCEKSFTTFRRKHHCRICGQIFCSNCTLFISGEKFNSAGKMRVCKSCISYADKYDDIASSDESVIEETSTGEPLRPTRTNESITRSTQPSLRTGSFLDQDVIIQAPTPPPRMAIPATRHGAAVEIHSRNAVQRSNSHRLRRPRYSHSTHNTRSGIFTSTQNDGSSNISENSQPNLRYFQQLSPNHYSSSPSIFGQYNHQNPSFPTLNADTKSARNNSPSFNSPQPNRMRLIDYSDDESENEKSMSLYEALHNDKSEPALMDQGSQGKFVRSASSELEGNASKTRLSRANTQTRSERAQASLWRMKNRMRSKTVPKLSAGSQFPTAFMGGFQRSKQVNFEEDAFKNMINNNKKNIFDFNDASSEGPENYAENFGTSVDTSFFPDKKRVFSLPNNDLRNLMELHAQRLLKQSLEDESLDSVTQWEKTLFKILKEISHINPDIRGGESFDIRQYVKLKRIPGAAIDKSMFVRGVVFSKNVALKSMPKELSNPQICLVMFPIEYSKTEQHFMSLELVLAQEKESLHKLVGRIIALNPDVLIVGASVSGLALEMLDNAGITVVSNVKPQVIERISKLTNADVVTSIDKLAVNPKLGTCELFESKQYVHENVRRGYLFLSGCNVSNGGTIVIRGGSLQVLKKVKSAIEFLIYVFFNLNLELSLFRDEYLTASNQDTKSIDVTRTNSKSSYHADFIEKFYSRYLSSSSVVKFYLPPLLQKAREADDKLSTALEELDQLRSSFEVENSTKELEANGQDEDESEGGAVASKKLDNEIKFKIAEFVLEKKIESLKLSLQSWQKQWELFYNHSPYLLESTTHQSLLFLYTMVNSKTTTPCVGPETLGIDYYWMSDISLGQYIEHISLTANGLCPEGCGYNLLDHYRSYVHGNGKVDVIVEPFQSRIAGLQNVILMWSYCKECRQSTPVIPMSENTWKYSFGKYLELSFWSEGVRVIGTCPHDFKHHIRYFGIYNLAVRMEYSKVETLELVVPKFKLHWKPDIDIKLKIELADSVRKKANAFFDSIWERLNRVKVDSMTIDKMEAGQKRIEELKEKVEEEKQKIFQMTADIYNKSRVTDHLPLNSVIRNIQELSVEWDTEFQEFELKFLPSEKDISRITSSQLRKLFMDKENDENLRNRDAEILGKEAIAEIQEEFNEKGNSEKDETSADSMKPPPLGRNVSEKISKMEAILGDEKRVQKTESKPELSPAKSTATNSKLHARSFSEVPPKLKKLSSQSSTVPKMPRLGTNELELELRKDNSSSQNSGASGKVKQLTSLFDQLHFDQISMEFEAQRERERRKLIANRYRAIPVIASRPIVEVFKNVHDAVEEELSDDDTSVKSPKRRQAQQQHPQQMIDEGETKKDEKKEEKKEELSAEKKKASGIPQTERASLMKTLTSFWADRSAALWKPLAYPLNSNEHIFVDSDVIVREDEPSSLIAFCLSSSDYVSKLKTMRDTIPLGNIVEGTPGVKTVDPSIVMTDNATAAESKLDPTFELERIMLKKTAIHLKYQFQEGTSLLSCKIFFAEQFDAFRQQCGIDENFGQSLSRCVKWDSTGGKSGSAFLKTLDDRFIIKELSHSELDAFVKFAPSYFEYLAQALFHDLPTVLAKIFGFYQIHIRNPIDNRNIKIALLIMENLFYDRKTSRIFDLKGSMRNRHVEQTGKENEVLLDENMVEYIYESPLFVKEYAKKLLRTSLWNDTLFLSRMNVMDYSLVIGIDSENHELVVGIIDCIRTFTWDKKLESWVKEKGLVGGGGKEPTVVTPRQYKNRFRDAMDRYILMVPDCWNQGPIE